MLSFENLSSEKVLAELRFLKTLQEFDRKSIKLLSNKRLNREEYDFVRRKIADRRRRLKVLYRFLFDK